MSGARPSSENVVIAPSTISGAVIRAISDRYP